MKQAQKAADAAAGGGQVGPASPVASTPKIALDKSVHVRQLSCALCGGPFTDAHTEIVNGQRWAPAQSLQATQRFSARLRASCISINYSNLQHSAVTRAAHSASSRACHNTFACSFLVHTVRWTSPNDDDVSPRSPTDDSMASSDAGAARPQFAHSCCALNFEQ